MINKRTAVKLGIEHQVIHLRRDTRKNVWENPHNSKWEGVESAALGWFMEKGWSGYAGEGGLILNLIKAMSFKTIPRKHRHTYIEALYAVDTDFEGERYDNQTFLNHVISASTRQVTLNFDRMAGRKARQFDSGQAIEFFPGLKRSHLLELLETFGNETIFQIAEIFAKDPYEYRKGWPDLTIWRDKMVAFKEIKSPGDTIRRSQQKVIKEILLPLNLNVSIVDVSVMM